MKTREQILLEIGALCISLRLNPAQSVAILTKLQAILPEWGADLGETNETLAENPDDMAATLERAWLQR